jgi:hypothetical protein
MDWSKTHFKELLVQSITFQEKTFLSAFLFNIPPKVSRHQFPEWGKFEILKETNNNFIDQKQKRV